ncbi:16S rRNA (guanine(966)-N(2))-methyltransferase RsmD [Pandoraea sp.]|uniref:16S rRNA (guanine(966)-N(2))-methyltransferase RsmD n=1 Tax=Pandoraea sp. TaxID=1883445 RepID=UPI00121ED558|nr:16S rRNA (guanine(966)-N(2))-methyltransferase RsmD [Pandoraea sp.]TAL54177.1 MAG: 16S rRNA (guanine(966)-N(2))-methyltransferase RsmD [Pandoraea sp.]TAM15820.1 MAG: 16S rRNA (guanine(966)-N(2))-methyltransferase RsmD [Pandoraea sp.]
MNSVRGAKSPPQQVRIIGGRWKRTLLPVVSGEGLRPTPDRVRETLFNWLGQDLSGLRCLDLFAGSGALGFEAASRGAASVVLVEKLAASVRQLEAIRQKLAATQVDILHGDARRLVGKLGAGSFDVIFLDPPFGQDWLPQVLPDAVRLLAPGGVLYVEAEAPVAADLLEATGLRIARQAKAGAVHYHLLQSESIASDDND